MNKNKCFVFKYYTQLIEIFYLLHWKWKPIRFAFLSSYNSAKWQCLHSGPLKNDSAEYALIRHLLIRHAFYCFTETERTVEFMCKCLHARYASPMYVYVSVLGPFFHIHNNWRLSTKVINNWKYFQVTDRHIYITYTDRALVCIVNDSFSLDVAWWYAYINCALLESNCFNSSSLFLIEVLIFGFVSRIFDRVIREYTYNLIIASEFLSKILCLSEYCFLYRKPNMEIPTVKSCLCLNLKTAGLMMGFFNLFVYALVMVIHLFSGNWPMVPMTILPIAISFLWIYGIQEVRVRQSNVNCFLNEWILSNFSFYPSLLAKADANVARLGCVYACFDRVYSFCDNIFHLYCHHYDTLLYTSYVRMHLSFNRTYGLIFC